MPILGFSSSIWQRASTFAMDSTPCACFRWLFHGLPRWLPSLDQLVGEEPRGLTASYSRPTYHPPPSPPNWFSFWFVLF